MRSMVEGALRPQLWIESTLISARSQKELLRINGITAGAKNFRTGFVHTSCPSRIISSPFWRDLVRTGYQVGRR
jgi:hypothetical protein